MGRKASDKQGRLPDMEEPSIPAIDKAADAYAAARDQRMEILKEDIDLQEKLKELMKKHNLTTYIYDDNVVSISDEIKVKAKKKKAPAVDAEE